jgi:NADH-quinone oxidoreductase subunit M
VATSGIILGAAYMLWLYQRVMFGKLDDVNASMKDLNAREMGYFAPLVIAAFWIGLMPSPIMNVLHKPIENLVMQINPEFYAGMSLEEAKDGARARGIRAMEAALEHELTGGDAQHDHDGHDHGHEDHEHHDHAENGGH